MTILDAWTHLLQAWQSFDRDAGPELAWTGDWRRASQAAVACLLLHALLFLFLVASADRHQFFPGTACWWLFIGPALADGLLAAAAMAYFGWMRGDRMTNRSGTIVGDVPRYLVFPLVVGVLAGILFMHAIPFGLSRAFAAPARVTATVAAMRIEHAKSGVSHIVDASAFEQRRLTWFKSLHVSPEVYDAAQVDGDIVLEGQRSWLGMDVQSVRVPPRHP